MELSKWVWSLFFSWEAEAIIYMLVYEQMRAEKSLTVISSSWLRKVIYFQIFIAKINLLCKF